MKKYSLLILMLFGITFANAQEAEEEDPDVGDAHVSNYRDWSASFSFGQFLSYGDLASFDPGTENGYEFDYGLGLQVTKYFNSVLGAKARATYGKLSGSTSGGEVYFENNLYFDYNFSAVVNLNALALMGRQRDRGWTALVSLGLGLSHHQTERYDAGSTNPVQWYDPDDALPFMSLTYMPADAVIKFQLSEAWDLDLGMQMKYYFSDQVDGFETGISNDVVFYPYIGATYNFGAEDAESIVYTNPLDDMYFEISEVKDNFDKLTTDDDGDGVNNYFDEDNATPEGVAVGGDGTALDVDDDGIPDHMDEDPFTGKGAKVDAQGRAVDSDKDGVADYIDKEPNTPSGELVNFQGKALGSAAGGGGAYLPSVYFPFNSATVSAANEERLATIAIAMKNNPDISISLVGNADVRGTEEYNMQLSRRRAEAVKQKLVQIFNIDGGRISIESQGEGTPLAQPRENYSLNRRVDVNIQ